jgi:FHA domain
VPLTVKRALDAAAGLGYSQVNEGAFISRTSRVVISMTYKQHGELVPEGGGDNIPLIRDRMTVGRRESCDICLRHSHVSGLHCQLAYEDGFWWIRDLDSKNGIKVNGVRVAKKLLHPGDKIAIGQKTYSIEYQAPVGKHALEELLEDVPEEDVLNRPLLERAGLVHPPRTARRAEPPVAKPENEGDSA